MEMRTKQPESDEEEKIGTGSCYFDPECHKLVDWDGVGELMMGVFGRLNTMKSVSETTQLAVEVRARLVSFGVPQDRADDIATEWIRSVFKDYKPAQQASMEQTELHLDGFYFSFKTNPTDVVDRFEARTYGNFVTHYRNGPVGTKGRIDPATAMPFESFDIHGQELIGPEGHRGTVDRNGDILWFNGYTSRKERTEITKKGELEDCYFDPECHRLVDWDGVGELKMGVFGRLKMLKNLDEAKPVVAGLHARLVELGVPEDRADYIVTNWMKSVFKASLVYELAHPDPKRTEPLDGFYFSFKTGGDPAKVVDRLEMRTHGELVTNYRNGPVGSIGWVDSKTAFPMESFEIHGDELIGPVSKGTIDRNGDILWNHGYTSRREIIPTKAQNAEMEACYFDPECYELVDWHRVGELKMGVFGGRLESVDETRPSGAPARLVSNGVQQDRTDYFVTNWIESVFKGYESAHQLPEQMEHLNGFYFSFQTGGSPKMIVDRFEIRKAGHRGSFYRNGPCCSTSWVDSATATARESFEIRGEKVSMVSLGPDDAALPPALRIEGKVQLNGDIVWSHGYTSRKETDRLFFILFGVFFALSVLYPYLMRIYTGGIWSQAARFDGMSKSTSQLESEKFLSPEDGAGDARGSIATRDHPLEEGS